MQARVPGTPSASARQDWSTVVLLGQDLGRQLPVEHTNGLLFLSRISVSVLHSIPEITSPLLCCSPPPRAMAIGKMTEMNDV